MKVLVTGGAGFIGSHIADKLIAGGDQVVIVDNLSSGKREFVPKEATFIKADIGDRTLLDKVFATEQIEVIAHLAAQKSVIHSVEDPVFDAKENIIGSLTLFEAARQAGIKKIVFASTGGALYGETDNIPTAEDHPAYPESPYGIAKLTIEHYLRFYKHVHLFEPVILRLGNVYGPRQDPKGEAGVVAIFCGKILSKQPLIVYGDGKQTRDYVFVSDVAEAFQKALDFKGDGIMNIGTSNEGSVLDLIGTLENGPMKRKLEVRFEPSRLGELQRSCLEVKLAKSKLDWQPRHSLTEGLHETFEWFTAQTI